MRQTREPESQPRGISSIRQTKRRKPSSSPADTARSEDKARYRRQDPITPRFAQRSLGISYMEPQLIASQHDPKTDILCDITLHFSFDALARMCFLSARRARPLSVSRALSYSWSWGPNLTISECVRATAHTCSALSSHGRQCVAEALVTRTAVGPVIAHLPSFSCSKLESVRA
jgi:hypothetical protein